MLSFVEAQGPTEAEGRHVPVRPVGKRLTQADTARRTSAGSALLVDVYVTVLELVVKAHVVHAFKGLVVRGRDRAATPLAQRVMRHSRKHAVVRSGVSRTTMQVRPPVVASVHEPLVMCVGIASSSAFGAALGARVPL